MGLMFRRARDAAVALPVFVALWGCASAHPLLPVCASIEQLEPPPDSKICEAPELDALRSDLSRIVEPEAGSLLVRVEFDETSKASKVCADGRSAADAQARMALAGQLGEIMKHAPGPACLAGRRLDLNRRRSTLAEIERVEESCSEEMRHSTEAMFSVDLTTGTNRQYADCIARNADWVLIERSGQTLLFVKPDGAEAPPARAADTASRCSRDLDAQIACIEQDGFELVR